MTWIRQYRNCCRVLWAQALWDPGFWGRLRPDKENHVSEAQVNMEVLPQLLPNWMWKSLQRSLNNRCDGCLLPRCGWPHRNRLFPGGGEPACWFYAAVSVPNPSPDALCKVFFSKFFEWFVSRMSRKALNPWETSAGDPHGLFESGKGQIRWFIFSLCIALGQSRRDISMCWYSVNIP